MNSEIAARYLNNIHGEKCLAIGCNTGKECSYFINLGFHEVDGLDVVDEIGSEYQHPNVRYFKMSAENMEGIENNCYDLVYCFATMEHIPRIDMAFSEMVRVTKSSGIIYCVSAPLWNSKQGHHKAEFFNKYPWIHLRMNEEEIVKYCETENIAAPVGTTMKGHIEYMLNPQFFNKEPAWKYIEVCANLKDVEIIRNDLAFGNPSELNQEIYSELMPKGYTPEELLAEVHTFIAKKL